MPLMDGWHKRYNSPRLLGYDYSSHDRPIYLTLNAEHRFPVFAELVFAKRLLGSLLSDQTLARIRLHVFCLMPDHLHLLGCIKGAHDSLATFLNSFKSYTTQLYWKRGQEIAHETVPLEHAPLLITPSSPSERNQLRRALSEGRVTLRPECVRLKQFPKPSLRDFQHKTLWQERGFDHLIRNEDDFRETVKYILNNPVEHGFVSQPEYYPFSGVLNM
jgi:REP element-mobilizing transposase RayT